LRTSPPDCGAGGFQSNSMAPFPVPTISRWWGIPGGMRRCASAFGPHPVNSSFFLSPIVSILLLSQHGRTGFVGFSYNILIILQVGLTRRLVYSCFFLLTPTTPPYGVVYGYYSVFELYALGLFVQRGAVLDHHRGLFPLADPVVFEASCLPCETLPGPSKTSTAFEQESCQHAYLEHVKT